MRKYFEFYDNTKTYYSPIGEKYTPEVVSQLFYQVNTGLPVVIETDSSHMIFGGIGFLSQYRDLYDIDVNLSDEEALVEIERIANLPPVYEPTAEERIAAALEFQNILLMPDEEVE